MNNEKETEQKNCPKSENHIKPGDIKGKIEVSDNRERRDGPGGN